MSDLRAVIAAEFERTGSIRAAARAAGVSFDRAKRLLRKVGVLLAPVAGGSVGGSGDEASITLESPRLIRTLEDAVAFAEVDTKIWRVKSWECTAWQVGMKLREFHDAKIVAEKPVTRPLWRVSLKLERIVPSHVGNALEGLVERFRGGPQIPFPSTTADDGHLVVMDLVDVHFGKLAWAAETGQNYDLKIAEWVYRNAVADILGRADAYPVDEFLMPIGSDFLHVDNLTNSTTAGTPQDVDGRLAKILEVALASVAWAVEMMASRAPVWVSYIPGNHDRLMSLCLAMMLRERFHKCHGIHVDCAPTARKYHRYGKILIGMTHGNEEKHAELPLIMATERPAEWAESSVREWHVGHHHKPKRVSHLALDTYGGVPVRTLNSLSAVDAWHYRKGFVGTNRAAEAYFYSRDHLVGWLNSPVRDNP